MALGDHYVCDSCHYEWRTKKDVGVPFFCSHCRSEKIELAEHRRIRLDELRKKEESDKRKLEEQKKLMTPFPIKGWHMFFYVLGLLGGLLHPIFWIYQYFAHRFNDEDYIPFIKYNLKFHKRVEYWGYIVMAILFFITIISIFQ